MEQGYIFDGAGARRVIDAVRKVEGRAADPGDQGRGARGGANRLIRAKITGNTSLGNNRWTYSWEQVEKTAAGYGGWTTLSGGVSGTDDAYNRIEEMNDGAGVEGNGVDVDGEDFPAGFSLQPAPTGAIVALELVVFTVAGQANLEWWFSYENGVDGTCS